MVSGHVTGACVLPPSCDTAMTRCGRISALPGCTMRRAYPTMTFLITAPHWVPKREAKRDKCREIPNILRWPAHDDRMTTHTRWKVSVMTRGRVAASLSIASAVVGVGGTKAVELERLCTLGTQLHAVASPVIDENDGVSGRCDGPTLRLICPRL
jgi:hypothetical protein